MRSISFLSHVVCTYICFLTVPAYVQAFSIGATSHHGTVSISPCKEEEGTWQFNFAQRCARRGAVHSNLSCLCSVKSNQKCDSCAKPVTSLQMLSTNRHHSPIVECTSIKNRSLFMSTNELQNELREGERSTFFQRIFRVFLQSLIALKHLLSPKQFRNKIAIPLRKTDLDEEKVLRGFNDQKIFADKESPIVIARTYEDDKIDNEFIHGGYKEESMDEKKGDIIEETRTLSKENIFTTEEKVQMVKEVTTTTSKEIAQIESNVTMDNKVTIMVENVSTLEKIPIDDGKSMERKVEIADTARTNPNIQQEQTMSIAVDEKVEIVEEAESTSKMQQTLESEIDANSMISVQSIPTTQWPQYPILLAPTPGSGTRVKTVRYAGSLTKDEYLMDESTNNLWWRELEKRRSENLGNIERIPALSIEDDIRKSGNGILPINNGNEPDGKSLVIDFETDHFEGTLQVRIRKANGTTSQKYDDSYGFFSTREAQYHCVISGRFKKENIPMTECVTGHSFKRPLKMPPAYITKGALKVVSFFAPRLQADLYSGEPTILSPLGSTPQSIQVDEIEEGMICSSGTFRAVDTILNAQEEPTCMTRKLLDIPTKGMSSTSVSRAKERKKAFDKLCAKENKSEVFRTDKVYTFEFLQHLFDYETMELNLGGILGKSKLSGVLNGQPLNIMAAHQSPHDDDSNVENGCLWSFDIWHESLISKNE